MARTARISTPVEAADPGDGRGARRLATTAQASSPSRCSRRAWVARASRGPCPRSGAPSRVSSPRPGASLCCARCKDTNVAFVSSARRTTHWRATDSPVPPRRAAPATGRWRSSCRPTASTTPCDAAQALVTGALLASYKYKQDDAITTFDVVPLGSPLPTVETHDDVTTASRAARPSPTASTGPSSSSTHRPGTCRRRSWRVTSRRDSTTTTTSRSRSGPNRASAKSGSADCWASVRVRRSRVASSTRPTTRARRASCPTSRSSARASPSTPGDCRSSHPTA